MNAKVKSAPTIDATVIQPALGREQERMEQDKMDRFIRAYDSMDMVDIYSSGMMSKMRLAVIREMTGHQVKVIR